MATAGLERMRSAIIDAYPGRKWELKVNEMPERQVIAVYNHFLRAGMFNKIHQPKKVSDENRQFTLEDYGIDLQKGVSKYKYYSLKLGNGKANTYGKILNDDYDYLADSVHGVFYDD